MDASEIPPTFGVPFDIVIGIIAGGDIAIRKAVESAEDDIHGAWKDLARFKPGKNGILEGGFRNDIQTLALSAQL